MGLDAGDYDGSGRPSLWVTNYENELPGLYHNKQSGRGRSSTTDGGGRPGRQGQKNVGWGTAFLDVDLDGWEDLFVVNGHVVRYHSETGAAANSRPCCTATSAAGSRT